MLQRGWLVRLMSAVAVCAPGFAYANDFELPRLEYAFMVPVTDSLEYKLKSGGEFTIDGDQGFGFGVIGFHSDRLATRGDFTWNSSFFSTELIPSNSQLAENEIDSRTLRKLSGVYDAFTLTFSGEYYLLSGNLKPFVAASFGWSFIDSNIPTGDQYEGCWYDPWSGAECWQFETTYGDTSWFVGVGAGVRFDISDQHYLRVGIFQNRPDFDAVEGSPTMTIMRFEFGGLLESW